MFWLFRCTPFHLKRERNKHDWLELINSTSSVRADLQHSPLKMNDFILYCDGSSIGPDDETILSGYAFVD